MVWCCINMMCIYQKQRTERLTGRIPTVLTTRSPDLVNYMHVTCRFCTRCVNHGFVSPWIGQEVTEVSSCMARRSFISGSLAFVIGRRHFIPKHDDSTQ